MSKKNKRKEYRSGNKRCILCGYVGPLIEHHINGRKIPNWDNNWNKINCCPNCHDKIHMNVIKIYKWVNTTDGKFLLWKQNKKKHISSKR